MNADIRLSVNFWGHPKTVKLKRKLGLEGPVALQMLWAWAAQNRPDGNLSDMDDEDIEIAASWDDAKAGELVSALVELHWLDKTETGYALHDWVEHNGYASSADDRSDKARFARLAQVNKETYEELRRQGVDAISADEYKRLTHAQHSHGDATANAGERHGDAGRMLANGPAPSPSPSPIPTPIPTPIPAINNNNNSAAAFQKPPEPPLDLDEAQALTALTQSYELCPEYYPDPPKEMRLIRELRQEFPGISLVAEFRRARDWLAGKPVKERKKNLLVFLRNWISNAAKRQGGEQEAVVFVPEKGGGVKNA